MEPPDAAVAVRQTVLGLVERSLPPKVSLDPFANRRRIVGVQKTEPVVRAIAHLMVLEAEQLLEKRIGIELAGDQVPVPYADVTRKRGTLIAIVSGHGGPCGSYGRVRSRMAAIRRQTAW
jgi:hypothetical protein